jgi:hypothetical protein
VENSPREYQELPREEALVRLYQLRDQLDFVFACELQDSATGFDGRCQDCAAHAALYQLKGVTVCWECAVGRETVRRALAAAQRPSAAW